MRPWRSSNSALRFSRKEVRSGMRLDSTQTIKSWSCCAEQGKACACVGNLKSPSRVASAEATVLGAVSSTSFPPGLSLLILQQPCEVGRD
jgi:hypothetical protein